MCISSLLLCRGWQDVGGRTQHVLTEWAEEAVAGEGGAEAEILQCSEHLCLAASGARSLYILGLEGLELGYWEEPYFGGAGCSVLTGWQVSCTSLKKPLAVAITGRRPLNWASPEVASVMTSEVVAVSVRWGVGSRTWNQEFRAEMIRLGLCLRKGLRCCCSVTAFICCLLPPNHPRHTTYLQMVSLEFVKNCISHPKHSKFIPNFLKNQPITCCDLVAFQFSRFSGTSRETKTYMQCCCCSTWLAKGIF